MPGERSSPSRIKSLRSLWYGLAGTVLMQVAYVTEGLEDSSVPQRMDLSLDTARHYLQQDAQGDCCGVKKGLWLSLAQANVQQLRAISRLCDQGEGSRVSRESQGVSPRASPCLLCNRSKRHHLLIQIVVIWDFWSVG